MSQAQAKAQAIHDKLLKGEECPEEAKTLLSQVKKVPDALVQASLGNRPSGIKACPSTLRVLLESQGDPNGQDPMTKSPIIHSACWHGSVDVVRILLDSRADMEAKEDRMKTPPLNTALAAGNAAVCLELLNRNADVLWKHQDGATALHVATAWIASSHNAQLRLPPVGEEPRAVILMMLHNGVDPTQTEGMSRSSTRGTGMTPLEAFRRDIAMSPWRTDEKIGPKFDKTAHQVHTLLEQGERAVKRKHDGNTAFKEKKYEEALKSYGGARQIWEDAGIRGHHTAVLWSNEAVCHKKMENWKECQHACEQGLTHYCSASIQSKLKEGLKEAEDELKKIALGQVEEKPPPKPRKPPTQLKDGFLESQEEPLYPSGSVQGQVTNPGPFICNFEEAKEAGFVDGVDGWKDRMKREEQELDEQLVKEGLLSPDLLDDPKTLDLINRLPPCS